MSFPFKLLTILNNSVEHLCLISSVLPETLRAGVIISGNYPQEMTERSRHNFEVQTTAHAIHLCQPELGLQ